MVALIVFGLTVGGRLPSGSLLGIGRIAPNGASTQGPFEESTLKRIASIMWMVALVFSSVALVAGAADAPTIVMANQEKFSPAPAPYPAGSTLAVLSGDPSKAGSQYAVRLKLPDGARIGAHAHGDTENVTVLSGTLMVGVGTAFDAAHMMALTAGSYVSIPAGTPHFAVAKGETLLQVNGVGPSSMSLIK